MKYTHETNKWRDKKKHHEIRLICWPSCICNEDVLGFRLSVIFFICVSLSVQSCYCLFNLQFHFRLSVSQFFFQQNFAQLKMVGEMNFCEFVSLLYLTCLMEIRVPNTIEPPTQAFIPATAPTHNFLTTIKRISQFREHEKANTHTHGIEYIKLMHSSSFTIHSKLQIVEFNFGIEHKRINEFLFLRAYTQRRRKFISSIECYTVIHDDTPLGAERCRGITFGIVEILIVCKMCRVRSAIVWS